MNGLLGHDLELHRARLARDGFQDLAVDAQQQVCRRSEGIGPYMLIIVWIDRLLSRILAKHLNVSLVKPRLLRTTQPDR